MADKNFDYECQDAEYELTFVIPRSPTWFRPNALACLPWRCEKENSFSEIAFISYELLSIYKIHFGQLNGEEGHYIEFGQQFKAHDDTINSVTAILHNVSESMIPYFVTCGADHFLRIWGKVTRFWKLEKQICLRQDINPTVCDALSLVNSMCILVGSNLGHVVVWNVCEQRISCAPVVKKFEKDCATCCCWLNRNSIDATNLTGVVGYKSGIVCAYSYRPVSLTNEGQLSALFHINAHDFDVCGLTPVTLFNKESSYFASSGRDSSIKIWSLEDAQCKHTARFQFRRNQQSNEQTKPESSQGKAWIPIAAVENMISENCPSLLAFDSKGDMHTWDCHGKPRLCDNTTSSHHSGLVFVLAAIPSSPNLFVSLGIDGQLIVWKFDHGDWKTIKPVASHVYFMSRIASMNQGAGACSPLAVGLSDGCVALLKNIGPPAPNKLISMQRLWPFAAGGIPPGIISLAWNPDPQFDNLLAVGSGKGHIDVIDVTKFQKNGRPKQSKTLNAMDAPVYRVTWGPRLFTNLISGETEKVEINEEQETISATPNRLYVYAVCKGSIYLRLSQHKPLVNMNANFHKCMPNRQSDGKFTDISFRMFNEDNEIISYSCLVALGSNNGAINVFGFSSSNGISPICRTDLHKKCINAIAWSCHPDRLLLAVGSNHSFITITDLTEYKNKVLSEPIQLSTCLVTLEPHGNRITGLDWSPHNPDLLLSTSFDNTAAVCCIGPPAFEQVASFRGHVSRVFACTWCRQTPDLAFTGEEFGYLVGWRPSLQSNKSPPSSRKHRQPTNIPAANNTKEEEIKVQDVPTLIESIPLPDPQEVSKKRISIKQLSLFPNLFSSSTSQSSPTDISHLDLSSTPPIHLQSKLSIVLDFLDPDVKRAEFELFRMTPTSRISVVRFVEQEAKGHLALASGSTKGSRLDAYFCLLLWLGRAELVAKQCVELQHMPFWLMWALELALKGGSPRFTGSSLIEINANASATSNDFEGDFLHQKVLQLRDGANEYNKAATLLMCACRTVDAVTLLLSRGRAKEALILFRLRLPPSMNQEMYRTCLSTLAIRQMHTGLPASALCHLANSDVETAIDQLLDSCTSHSALLIDRIAALWSALSVHSSYITSCCSSSNKLAFKITHLIIQFACTGLDERQEKDKWLSRWSDALTGQKVALWIICCARFLLVTTDADLAKPSEEEVISKELEILSVDRQPSVEPGVCLANLIIDFAVIQLKSTANDVSFGTLRTSLSLIEHSQAKDIIFRLNSLPD